MAAYVFTLCEVTNPHDNFKQYAKQASDLVAKHGGRYIVRGKPLDGAQGPFEGKLLVGLEFPSEEVLKAYKEDYAKILPLREGSGTYQTAAFAGT